MECAGICSSFCLLVFLHLMKIWSIVSQMYLVLLLLFIHNQLYKWIPGKFPEGLQARAGNFFWVDSCYALCTPKVTQKNPTNHHSAGIGGSLVVAIAGPVQGWPVNDFWKCILVLKVVSSAYMTCYLFWNWNAVLLFVNCMYNLRSHSEACHTWMGFYLAGRFEFRWLLFQM